MPKYENIGGGHVQLDGTLIPHGATIESDDPSFSTYLAYKFKHVMAPMETPTTSPTTTVEVVPEAKATQSTDRVDVTADFPKADEADLTVAKDKAGYWVCDGSEEPANEKALQRRSVNAFIKKYLAD